MSFPNIFCIFIKILDNRDKNGDLIDYFPGNSSEEDDFPEDLSENSENFDADSEENEESESGLFVFLKFF